MPGSWIRQGRLLKLRSNIMGDLATVLDGIYRPAICILKLKMKKIGRYCTHFSTCCPQVRSRTHSVGVFVLTIQFWIGYAKACSWRLSTRCTLRGIKPSKVPNHQEAALKPWSLSGMKLHCSSIRSRNSWLRGNLKKWTFMVVAYSSHYLSYYEAAYYSCSRTGKLIKT